MRFRTLTAVFVFLLVFLYACSDPELTGYTTRDVETIEENAPEEIALGEEPAPEEENFFDTTFAEALSSDLEYKCTFNVENAVLYTDAGNYRIDFGGSYATGVRTSDGGLCVNSWNDRETLVLKNCVTGQQYNNLESQNKLHKVNPGGDTVPTYSTAVSCTENNEDVVFSAPDNYRVVDFSQPTTGPTGAVIRVVEVN